MLDSDVLKDRGVTIFGHVAMLRVTSATLLATCAPLAGRDCARRASFPLISSTCRAANLSSEIHLTTWQEFVEYCEYLSRAVSIKLTESKHRYSRANMAVVAVADTVYIPNDI